MVIFICEVFEKNWENKGDKFRRFRYFCNYGVCFGRVEGGAR